MRKRVKWVFIVDTKLIIDSRITVTCQHNNNATAALRCVWKLHPSVTTLRPRRAHRNYYNRKTISKRCFSYTNHNRTPIYFFYVEIFLNRKLIALRTRTYGNKPCTAIKNTRNSCKIIDAQDILRLYFPLL